MKGRKWLQRAAGISAGVIADSWFGDPQRGHPVALLGRGISAAERVLYADRVDAGVALVAVSVIPPTLVCWKIAQRFPVVSLAAVTWASLGGTTLAKVGEALATALSAGDVEQARTWIPWLCSRDPAALDASGMARAGVESLAENTCDAAIAPLVAAVVGGAPLVVAHRVINTLDAMVGYRNARYERFGKAAAKLDDLAAFVPARINAATHVLLASVADPARGREAIRAWKEDAPAHPSPNAGPVEATAAAALGVSLGGTTTYAWGTEQRPQMGRGDAVTVATLPAAVQLTRRTSLTVATVAVIGLLAVALCQELTSSDD
ncbi:CobD/CbiB family cobalamin biosynthesis protein [Corynebacterium choanae]|uniref:Cobalamin biosynthesis protein CobD n=1 Tax=Corynebacterium choanae TaxID=1862358 RepID=A0A3G6J7I5_9CORY|nr:CobD/CbiB family cobalamin biosynthesis protein [Corynebacterium choanae]AZA14017.1 cobalamin biosynthesis protein [Corynebacterium choanae]